MPDRYAPLRVLVVEDHAFQRIAAEELVRQLGAYRVRCAASGREASAILATEPFDVVLCDIEMPDGNGPELIADLHQRHERAFAGVPPVWVWMTALADDILDSHRDLARELGIRHVYALRKPLAADTLEDILEDALTRNPSAEAMAASRVMAGDDDLLAAVRTGDALSIVFQPQFDIATGRLAGAEALCRWRHPTLGLIRPDLFIARLEALDAAEPVFLLGVQRCLDVQQRLAAHGVAVPLGINGSAQTLCRHGLLETFDAMVAASGVPRERLTIELTEGFPVNDPLALSVTLNRLRLLGYGVAIDDFGVGIATLKLLADLPFTQIKLDRSFVGNVDGHGQRAVICRNVIGLARDLGLECVAEGVETEAQRAALLALGCGIGQGYLWSPPLAADAFVNDALARAVRPPA